MLQTVSPLILKLSLFLVTAAATHLVMSFGQTLIHYKVAHHPMCGKIFRDHINFHHTHYSDAHLVSRTSYMHWQRWFAWRPVIIYGRAGRSRVVWLQYVERIWTEDIISD
ncbi:MAG: hypothetical protein WBG18_18845, partial [Xanthobacteraceae bacterium]